MVRGARWVFASALLNCPTSVDGVGTPSLFEFVQQVTEISPKSFSQHAESSVPWVLNCYSPVCGHCKRFAPTVSAECRGWVTSLLFVTSDAGGESYDTQRHQQ